MIPYLISWGVLAYPTLARARGFSLVAGLCLLVFLTLLIGLRDEVGGDWVNYLPYLDNVAGLPLSEVVALSDPGYALLNWIGVITGGGIYLVNTVCGLFFSFGLLRFCRAQPRPWLALLLAFPYLITVVAMGYSRQGVAIGYEMLALLALERGRLLQFLGWIGLAATFHRTVLAMLILPAATLTPRFHFSQLIRLLLLAGAGYGLYSAFLAEDIQYFQSSYLDAGYQSQGALVRVILCLLPALLFLLKRGSFRLQPDALRLWTLISLLAVAAAIGLATVASSTAVDRLALYLIPLQLFVGSRIPDARLFGIGPTSWSWLLVLFSLAVLLVWLRFAGNAFAWLPYRNLLLPL